MKLRSNLNTLLYYLSRGVEIKLKSGHKLAMHEASEEPGFSVLSSEHGPMVMQIGSDTAWMCLIQLAKEITDEELKALEPKIEQPQYDSLDIYLTKDGTIVGLHAVGDKDAEWTLIEEDGTRTKQKGFRQMEAWGNEYDEEHNMLGRGSFRVFSQIEEAAKEMEAEGWVRRNAPKKKES